MSDWHQRDFRRLFTWRRVLLLLLPSPPPQAQEAARRAAAASIGPWCSPFSTAVREAACRLGEADADDGGAGENCGISRVSALVWCGGREACSRGGQMLDFFSLMHFDMPFEFWQNIARMCVLDISRLRIKSGYKFLGEYNSKPTILQGVAGEFYIC